jgi:hypothetical protein
MPSKNFIRYLAVSDFDDELTAYAIPPIAKAPSMSGNILKYLIGYSCKYTNNFVDATTFYGFAEVRGLFVFNKIKFPITNGAWCSKSRPLTTIQRYNVYSAFIELSTC